MGRRTSALAILLWWLPCAALASTGVKWGPTQRFRSGHTVKRGPGGNQWPTNIITVTNHYVNTDCSAVPNVANDGARVDACTGAGTASPSLNGFDGADIQWALTQCEAAGGCALDLGCHTYENAENTIYSTAPVADTGRNGVNYGAGFQRGLDIFGRRPGHDGCATGTQLRSRNGTVGPGWDSTFPTAAIFFIHQWDPAGTPTRGVPRIRFRDFECDGESDLQPSPETIGGSFLANDASQFHMCVGQHVQPLVRDDFLYWEVTGLNAHHFEGVGIRVGDATTSLIAGNTVANIGCLMDYPGTGVGALPHVCDLPGAPFTSLSDTCYNGGAGCRPACTAQFTCPTCGTVWRNGTAVDGQVECGCGAGDPGNCRGWMTAAEENAIAVQSPGIKVSAAFGILSGGFGRSVISANNISFAVKYGIERTYSGAAGTGTSEETGTIVGNTVSNSMVGIALGTHSVDTVVVGNNITSAGLNGGFCTAIYGIQANGRRRSVVIDSNTISGSHCTAIGITSWDGYGTVSPDLVIQNNVLSNNGDWSPLQNTSAYGHSQIAFQPNVADAPCVAAEEQFTSSIRVLNNTMSAIHGFAGLQIARTGTMVCPANVANPLVITGNSTTVTDWGANANDMGQVRALNLTATGMTLTGDGAAGRTFTWIAGSTGTCSGFVKVGSPNPPTVTDNSGNAIGTCP